MNNRIYPCLWFREKAEEAAAYYASIFRNFTIQSQNKLVTILNTGDGQMMLLNGNRSFPFNPSISFYVVCETEEELNEYWPKLLEGGHVLMELGKYEWSPRYGWLSDKYGVNWQLTVDLLSEVAQRVTPTLMFTGAQAGRAREAIEKLVALFPGSHVRGILLYAAGEQDAGLIKHTQFTLGGYGMMAMDSSFMHGFAFNESVSFVISCETQEEIDKYWGALTEGGEESMCGWLKDAYGISWQVVPSVLPVLMNDPERSKRVIQAMLKMRKFNINELKEA